MRWITSVRVPWASARGRCNPSFEQRVNLLRLNRKQLTRGRIEALLPETVADAPRLPMGASVTQLRQ